MVAHRSGSRASPFQRSTTNGRRGRIARCPDRWTSPSPSAAGWRRRAGPPAELLEGPHVGDLGWRLRRRHDPVRLLALLDEAVVLPGQALDLGVGLQAVALVA